MSAQDIKRHPRVGIGVLIFKEDHILVGKRKNSHGTGTYALPGGHLEFSESFGECAVRETLEETGLAVANPRVAWVENSFWVEGSNDAQHYVTIFMRADLVDVAAEPKVLEPEKCEHWGWVRWPEIPEPVFLPLQKLLSSSFHPGKPAVF